MEDKRCYKCGCKAVAKMNGTTWLCEYHAQEATITSLSLGAPVIWANRGDPQYLLIPTGVKHGRN
jgi:hypothetical protein